MRTSLIIVTLLFSSFAQAGVVVSHDATIELCPNTVFDGSELTFASQIWEEVVPVPDRPSHLKVRESTWWPITCEVNEVGDFTVAIELPEDVYPLQDVPDMATCSAKDSKGKTHVLTVELDLLDASDMACWLRAGMWHGQEPTLIYAATDHDGHMALPLLPGHDFVGGTYDAKIKSGDVFPGVACVVQDNGKTMTVFYDTDAIEGEGYCPVPDGNIGTAQVPFEIVIVD